MAALTRGKLQQAFKRMPANKGVAGLDIDQTAVHRRMAWPAIREQVLLGTYRPRSVRRVTIPKSESGERELGIPTVTDRLIQQALLQVLALIFDPTFSEHSYGFRPGRGAHDAVLAAQSYVQSARSWWTWTWQNSLTGSITTSPSTACRSGSETPVSSG